MTRNILLFAVAWLTAMSINSQNLEPQPMDAAIRYGKLSNGLTYYIRHNEQPKDRAEFYIAQNVGAILEEDDQNGLAHFLEHMAFNGTKHYPGKQLINYFESIGVRYGANINAYTSLDETVYNLSDVPTYRDGIIDSALLVLHDWSSFILLENSEIDKERGVIREEWRQGQNASRRLWKASNELLSSGSKYAIRDVIGDTAVINGFSYETLRNYYKKWYRPDLQAILVVGDIDVDRVEAKIKTLFADIPAPVSPAKRSYFSIPDRDQPVAGVFTDPEMQTTEVDLYYLFDAQPDSVRSSVQGYMLTLIRQLISLTLGERFDEITREPETPFSSLYGVITDMTRTKDAFVFGNEPISGKEQEARSRMLREVEMLRRFGITALELERAKTIVKSNYEKLYNERQQQKNNALVREYARHFLEAEGIPGIEWEYLFTRSILNSITLDMVNESLHNYLDNKGGIYTVLGPKKEGLTYPSTTQLEAELTAVKSLALSARVDSLSNKPLMEGKLKSGKVKKTSVNSVLGATEWVLSNGIKVIVKPSPLKEDEVRLLVISEGGSSLVSDSDLPSVSYATSVIEQSGLGAFDQTTLNKLLSGKIANLSPFINTYEEGFNGTSSVKDVETLLQLVYLNFTAPRKDKNAYDLFERAAMTYFENAALDPTNAYSDSINAIMYGYHPRILPQNTETLKKIHFETLYKRYTERFSNPGDFTFELVGNIYLDSLKPLIERYIGGLKTTRKRENWKDNNIRHVKGPLYKEVEKKLTVNKTTCYIHYLTDLPYTLTNRLLVSTLANILRLRYTATIREEEGGSYSVGVTGSTTYKPINLATLVIQFNTDPSLYKRMMEIVHTEMKRIAENGPTTEDLSKVKLNLIKQYAENKQDNAWWIQALSIYYRDKLDVLTDYDKHIEAVDAAAIQQLAKQFVDDNNVREILLVPEK